MKTTALILVCLVACKFGMGQLANDRKLFNIVPIHLGDSISTFEPHLRAVRVYGNDTTSSKSYQYIAALKKPLVVSDVSFRVALLEFDTDNRLKRLNLSKAYSDDKKFKRNSRRDYDRLVSYLSSLLGMEGQKKVLYLQVHEGFEWEIDGTILFVDLQATGVARSTSVGITMYKK
jgi:hypothetical protein